MRPRASRSLAGRVGVALVGNVMPPLAAFFTAPLLAQVLGADGRGEVSAATAPLMLMLGAATLGLPEAVTYFVAAGLGRLRRTLLTASAWIAGAGVAATILVAALAPFLGAGQGSSCSRPSRSCRACSSASSAGRRRASGRGAASPPTASCSPSSGSSCSRASRSPGR
jgi:hypothetical protein